MFTAGMTGSNTTTGFSITYNGVNIPVKVYKDGSLQNFTAAKISWQDSTAVYKYLDAGTTLELLYDSVQFIIVNNPIVLKSIRHTIYADGTVDGGHVGLTAIAFSDTLDYGWMACEHQSLLRTDYPKLFSYFQTHKIGSDTMLDIFGSADSDHFYLPDTREAALVGAGQNDSDTIAAHDVYTVGQFKDDQLQDHYHGYYYGSGSGGPISVQGINPPLTGPDMYRTDRYVTAGVASGMWFRYSDTTHGKQKGVKFIIKVL